MNKQAFGKWGEETAARYLEKKGYQILARNYRTPYGEIDLVARQGTVMVFVEVKARSSTRYGYPEEAVDEGKAERLLAAVDTYWQENEKDFGDWRVDVIAVRRLESGKEPEIVHFENALS